MSDVSHIWNTILQRKAKEGIGVLNVAEKRIFRANVFLVLADIGGISGALSNLGPQSGAWAELRDTADAIKAVGDRVAAELMLEAAAMLEAAPERGRRWSEFLEGVAPDLEARIVAELEGRVASLWTLLEEFTLRSSDDLDDRHAKS